MNVVEEITAIVDRVRGQHLDPRDETAQIRAAIAVLPDVDATDVRAMRWHEYVVQTAFGDSLAFGVAKLASIQALELTCAPVSLALLPIAEGQVGVLRYWACPGERLVKLRDTTAPLVPAAVARLRAEMERLADHGFYHPGMRGLAHAWVADPSGTILFDSWSGLQPLEPNERARLFRILDLALENRAPR